MSVTQKRLKTVERNELLKIATFEPVMTRHDSM
jgi:hypothetical protein